MPTMPTMMIMATMATMIIITMITRSSGAYDDACRSKTVRAMESATLAQDVRIQQDARDRRSSLRTTDESPFPSVSRGCTAGPYMIAWS